METKRLPPLSDRSSLEFVPDVGGLISCMALAMPPAFFAPTHQMHTHLRSAFKSLILALYPEIRLLILVQKQYVPSLKPWISENIPNVQVEIIETPSEAQGSRSMWIQDTVHARYSVGKMRLDSASSDNQSRNAAHLARHLNCSCDVLTAHLAGGNHLVGQGFRIVGCDSVRFTAERADVGSFQLAHQRLQELDPRGLYVFGFHPDDAALAAAKSEYRHSAGSLPVHQPGFHLDQYVSLTGTYINAKPVLLIADPIDVNKNEVRKITSLKAQLKASSERMTHDGFHVIRNPVPFSSSENGGGMPLHFYNNAIVENFVRPGKSRPTVWVPIGVSGQDKSKEDFDRENCAIWSNLGFDVVAVDGWGPLAAMQGAIRCASKVLARQFA